MTDAGGLWLPGSELPRRVRTMTAERMRWYADALETVSQSRDHLVVAPPNIHTDDQMARDNGLPGRVADGMVSTNWLSSALTDAFGDRYLRGGSLRTRYVRPIFEDERLEVRVRVTGVNPDADGIERLEAEVSCVKADGTIATAGAATVRLPD